MNLDPTVLKQLSLFATGFSVAFLAALWLSLIFWAFRDIRKRTRDPFMRILAVIVVAVLVPPGHSHLSNSSSTTDTGRRISTISRRRSPSTND